MKELTKVWLSIAVALLLLLIINRFWASRVRASYKEEKKEERCLPTPTPTILPTPTPEPTTVPTRAPEPPRSEPGPAPICGNGNIALVPFNFHVLRNGSQAILKWVPTGGDSVNVYYKQVGSNDWQYSLINDPNDGYVIIGLLNPKLGYEFAVEQKSGCGSGKLSAKAVVKDPPTTKWTLFTQTSWE